MSTVNTGLTRYTPRSLSTYPCATAWVLLPPRRTPPPRFHIKRNTVGHASHQPREGTVAQDSKMLSNLDTVGHCTSVLRACLPNAPSSQEQDPPALALTYGDALGACNFLLHLSLRAVAQPLLTREKRSLVLALCSFQTFVSPLEPLAGSLSRRFQERILYATEPYSNPCVLHIEVSVQLVSRFGNEFFNQNFLFIASLQCPAFRLRFDVQVGVPAERCKLAPSSRRPRPTRSTCNGRSSATYQRALGQLDMSAVLVPHHGGKRLTEAVTESDRPGEVAHR
jgi:hypothetical protein